MSYKLKASDMAPPTNPDAGAWFFALVGGVAGLILASKLMAAIGFHLVVVYWGVAFNIGNLATFVVIVAGVVLLGVPGHRLGHHLIDKRLAPKVKQTVLDAADEAAKRPRRRGRW
jgi:hypothetical protein